MQAHFLYIDTCWSITEKAAYANRHFWPYLQVHFQSGDNLSLPVIKKLRKPNEFTITKKKIINNEPAQENWLVNIINLKGKRKNNFYCIFLLFIN